MKKFLLLILIVLLMPTILFAQTRGSLSNVYASWVNVAATATTTVTFPNNSRDITIHNGDTDPVCVDLKGGTILGPNKSPGECRSSVDSYVMQLPGTSVISLYDYVTGSVSFRALGVTTASPVSVTVTY